jgi:hypothetical protein
MLTKIWYEIYIDLDRIVLITPYESDSLEEYGYIKLRDDNNRYTFGINSFKNLIKVYEEYIGSDAS